MSIRRTVKVVATSAVAATLAATGALFPTSPAAARPADCRLSVRISPDPGGLYSRAEVNCARSEHYTVRVIIRRKDFGVTWRPVADAERGYHQSGYGFVSASEPCSDVDPKKQYKAHAYLYDNRLPGPGVEVKDVQSNIVSGHC